MDLQFGNLAQLSWFWLLAACVVAIAWAGIARRRAQSQFATANLVARVLPARGGTRRALAAILVTVALSLLVVALIDIRWGKVQRDVPQKGIEVMFVLDVSRSMLAEDASPNRLQRAKQFIKDTVDEMAGDRVGLYVFAGDAKQQLPLTTHYDDFKQALDEVSPQNIRRGGSQLGKAIEAASKGFLTKSNAHKAMIVLTDGEDQESQPIEAARRAHAETGVRIFTVGLGDMDHGSLIPIGAGGREAYVTHNGERVHSKLNGDILRQVATESDGAYIPAGTKQVNMADVYHRYVESVEQEQFETAKISQFEARYQWFVGAGLLLLLVEVVITTWRSRPGGDFAVTLRGTKNASQKVSPASTTEHSTAA